METKDYNLKNLINRGLTPEEANTFLELLNKFKPTKDDIEGFEEEMNNAIPFEGGIGFTEALTGLKKAAGGY